MVYMKGKKIGQAMMMCTCEKYVKWWGNENMWICGEEEGNIEGSKMNEGKRKIENWGYWNKVGCRVYMTLQFEICFVGWLLKY